jgi:hypothetical protein
MYEVHISEFKYLPPFSLWPGLGSMRRPVNGFQESKFPPLNTM